MKQLYYDYMVRNLKAFSILTILGRLVFSSIVETNANHDANVSIGFNSIRTVISPNFTIMLAIYYRHSVPLALPKFLHLGQIGDIEIPFAGADTDRAVPTAKARYNTESKLTKYRCLYCEECNFGVNFSPFLALGI